MHAYMRAHARHRHTHIPVSDIRLLYNFKLTVIVPQDNSMWTSFFWWMYCKASAVCNITRGISSLSFRIVVLMKIRSDFKWLLKTKASDWYTPMKSATCWCLRHLEYIKIYLPGVENHEDKIMGLSGETLNRCFVHRRFTHRWRTIWRCPHKMVSTVNILLKRISDVICTY